MIHRSEPQRNENSPRNAALIVTLLLFLLFFPQALIYGMYLVSFISADIWDKLTALF